MYVLNTAFVELFAACFMWKVWAFSRNRKLLRAVCYILVQLTVIKFSCSNKTLQVWLNLILYTDSFRWKFSYCTREWKNIHTFTILNLKILLHLNKVNFWYNSFLHKYKRLYHVKLIWKSFLMTYHTYSTVHILSKAPTPQQLYC